MIRASSALGCIPPFSLYKMARPWSCDKSESASESDRFETQYPNPTEADFNWLSRIPSTVSVQSKSITIKLFHWTERTGGTASDVGVETMAHGRQWMAAGEALGTGRRAGLVGVPRLLAVIAEIHAASRPFAVQLRTSSTATRYHRIPASRHVTVNCTAIKLSLTIK